MPGGLALSFHARGLLVGGDTYRVKELLKSAGGRWDAELKGWVCPFDGKRAVLDALAASHEGQALAVRDGAKVRLGLAVGSGAGRELLVTGETFPVKALLKQEGGTWTPAIKAWTFRHSTRAELLKALRASPDVERVEDDEPGPSTPQRLPARQGPAADEGASAAKGIVKGKRQGKQALALKDGGGEQQEQQLQPRKKDGLKVVESGKRASKAERRADGSQAKTEEEKKERKISCARTGAHVQTESVTRKRKVVETGDKVVETKTIVVKRVRSKK